MKGPDLYVTILPLGELGVKGDQISLGRDAKYFLHQKNIKTNLNYSVISSLCNPKTSHLKMF